MRRYIYIIICMLFLFLTSCSRSSSLDVMEEIKAIGDKEPAKALVMLDSLEASMREQNEYTKCKYDLLKIRLNIAWMKLNQNLL